MTGTVVRVTGADRNMTVVRVVGRQVPGVLTIDPVKLAPDVFQDFKLARIAAALRDVLASDEVCPGDQVVEERGPCELFANRPFDRGEIEFCFFHRRRPTSVTSDLIVRSNGARDSAARRTSLGETPSTRATARSGSALTAM
jgi:hypothetical protein